MIYDCFTFFNELDLLEIRLNVLSNVVDRFVLVEAARTHSGKPKKLFYAENKDRFAAYQNKIIHIVVDDLLDEKEIRKDAYNLTWVNENRQRNAIARGLVRASLDDVILVSDLDEIPRCEKIKEALPRVTQGAIVRLVMDSFIYYVNFKDFHSPKWLLGTQILSVATWKKSPRLDNFIYDRFTVESENNGHTIHKIRFASPDYALSNGGWHFSYLGGAEAIKTKLLSFSHVEASVVVDQVEKRLASGENIFNGRKNHFGIPLETTFPKYMCCILKSYPQHIFPISNIYLSKTRYARYSAITRGVLRRFIVKLVPKFLEPICVKIMIYLRYR